MAYALYWVDIKNIHHQFHQHRTQLQIDYNLTFDDMEVIYEWLVKSTIYHVFGWWGLQERFEFRPNSRQFGIEDQILLDIERKEAWLTEMMGKLQPIRHDLLNTSWIKVLVLEETLQLARKIPPCSLPR